jgi:mRNA interferase MazF
VYWADLNPVRGREQASLRPVLIISHEALNRHSGTVIALAITSQPQRAGFPLTHPVENLRLPKTSWVKISQIRTLSVQRLGRRIGTLSGDELDRIVEGLFELIG